MPVNPFLKTTNPKATNVMQHPWALVGAGTCVVVLPLLLGLVLAPAYDTPSVGPLSRPKHCRIIVATPIAAWLLCPGEDTPIVVKPSPDMPATECWHNITVYKCRHRDGIRWDLLDHSCSPYNGFAQAGMLAAIMMLSVLLLLSVGVLVWALCDTVPPSPPVQWQPLPPAVSAA